MKAGWISVSVALAAAFAGLGCGGDDSGTDVVAAPASLEGRRYDASIASGSGVLASMGTYRVSFAANTYAVQGDGFNVLDSQGTYTYTAVGSVGIAAMQDSSAGAMELSFSYVTSTTGTYTMTAAAGGSQTGRFTER